MTNPSLNDIKILITAIQKEKATFADFWFQTKLSEEELTLALDKLEVKKVLIKSENDGVAYWEPAKDDRFVVGPLIAPVSFLIALITYAILCMM